jgi:hypothetical protein
MGATAWAKHGWHSRGFRPVAKSEIKFDFSRDCLVGRSGGGNTASCICPNLLCPQLQAKDSNYFSSDIALNQR